MANNPDFHIDEEEDEYNPDMDPFSDPAEDGSEGGAGDPFDFNPGPSSFQPAKTEPAPVPPGNLGAPNPPAPSAAPGSKTDRRIAGLTADVPVQMVAVMGKKTLTVKDILSLKKGQVVELNRFPNEAIDLVANGKLMAKGELVEIDGKLGVRIIKIFE